MKNTNQPNAQHTPGPWQLTQHLSYFGIYGDTKGVTMFHVADLPISKPELNTIDEQRANAQLIASAPELLIAVKCAKTNYELMLQDIESGIISGPAKHVILSMLERLNKAIAKAEGRA